MNQIKNHSTSLGMPIKKAMATESGNELATMPKPEAAQALEDHTHKLVEAAPPALKNTVQALIDTNRLVFIMVK